MTSQKLYRSESIAFHEAGHAVIGRVLGLVCGQASIVAGKDGAGHTLIADPCVTLARWKERGKCRDMPSVVLAHVMALVAGRETEIVCLGRSQGGDAEDDHQIAVMANELNVPGPRNPDIARSRYRRSLRRAGIPLSDNAMPDIIFDPAWDRYYARLVQRTRALIRRHRSSIERVAATLLERGTLEADEIDSMLGRAGPL